MRIPSLLLGLTLVAALSSCSDDPATPAAQTPTGAASVAAPSPTPTASATPTPVASPSTTASTVASPTGVALGHLTGDGIELPRKVLTFGTPVGEAVAALRAAWGRPSRDTGVVDSGSSPYGVCPGTDLRGLEYGRGALVVLFGNVEGPELTMYGWFLDSSGAPATVARPRALVGDRATFEFGIGTTVREAKAKTATGTFTVRPADDPLPASFTLKDQSAGFRGTLDGTAPTSRITSVEAGTSCGE